MCTRLVEPEVRFGRVWKTSPPPGYDLLTFRAVANRYTDSATLSRTLSTNNVSLSALKEHTAPYELRFVNKHMGKNAQEMLSYACVRACVITWFVALL